LSAALLATLILALPAAAERSQTGNLIVAVAGNISPLKLPRQRPAPVSLQIGGRIATADGSPLPRMKSIRLAIAGRGVLSTAGLSVCPRARLRNASTALALRRCRTALVGRGDLEADAFIANQKPFAIHATLLAFNGVTRCSRSGRSRISGRALRRSSSKTGRLWPSRSRTQEGRQGERTPVRDPKATDRGHRDAPCHSRPAVWVHAFSADPPLAIVLPFIIRRDGRHLQTSLTATVPLALGDLPHLASFQLSLFRRYRHNGQRRSYLSAACPAPSGFTGGFLTIAKATYSFADGRRLRIGAVRGCRTR
jgi:hypothetical protein